MLKIRLVTVVWGREHTDTFLRVGLRTLLAEGNVPALAHANEVIYTIYTTRDDAKRLEAEPAFASLRNQADVRLSLFSDGEIDLANYGSHGIPWNREIELARRLSQALFFIMPDVLYAEGTLMRWAAHFSAGAGAIFTIGPQVVLETVVPELERRFPDRDVPCKLNKTELYDILFRHFHPLHAAMRHDSSRRPSHPEYDVRLVPTRGLVIREIVSHPFCVYPSHYNQLRHYGPQDHLESVVFEPCATLSVEPLLKRLDGYYRKWPLTESRLSNLAVWWNYYATEACQYESAFPFDVCASDTQVWREQRRRAVAGGQFYRSQIINSGRIYDLFAQLQKRQSHKAAAILALAVHAGRLRRRLCLSEGAIIAIPSERALEANAERINALLVPGKENELIDLIADHVVLGRADAVRSRRARNRMEKVEHDAGDESLFTARGLPAEPLLSVASRADAPFRCGPFTVVMIDKVLWRSSSSQSAQTPESADSLSKDEMRPAPPAVGTFVVTKWARKSISHRVLYYLAHIPLLEPFVASILYPMVFPRHMKIFNPASRLFHAIRLRVRVIPLVGPLLRRALNLARRLVSLLRLGLRIVQVVKRDGLRLAWRKVLTRLNVNSPNEMLVSGHEVSRRQREMLDDIRNVRALCAVSEVLEDFETKMGGGSFKSEPLSLIRDLVSKNNIGSLDLLERALVGLTVQDPDWGEPWLELGFLNEDRGRFDEALKCFSRAMATRRPNDIAARDPHPAAVAGARHGQLSVSAGNDTDALVSFQLSLRHGPDQRMIAIEYANVLRRLGRVEEALSFYTEGMYYQESRWGLPSPPRDARTLEFSRLSENVRIPNAQVLQ